MEGHDHHDHSVQTSDPHAGHEMNHDSHAGHKIMDSASSMNHGGGGMGHEMAMVFHSRINETVLFSCWEISSVQGMIGSFFGIVVLAIFYEAIKLFREGLLLRNLTNCRCTQRVRKHELNHSHQNQDLLQGQLNQENGLIDDGLPQVINGNGHMFSVAHAVQTILYVIQVFISYLLMLIFMTYNVYLCVAVLIGCGLGYFLFGWRKQSMLDLGDHCG